MLQYGRETSKQNIAFQAFSDYQIHQLIHTKQQSIKRIYLYINGNESVERQRTHTNAQIKSNIQQKHIKCRNGISFLARIMRFGFVFFFLYLRQEKQRIAWEAAAAQKLAKQKGKKKQWAIEWNKKKCVYSNHMVNFLFLLRFDIVRQKLKVVRVWTEKHSSVSNMWFAAFSWLENYYCQIGTSI